MRPCARAPLTWLLASRLPLLPRSYAWGALMANQFGGDRNVEFLGGQTILGYYSLDGINEWCAGRAGEGGGAAA